MVSDDRLIEDLKIFAEELGKTPTQNDMNDEGPWSPTTYVKYFESWNGALKEAGLDVNQEKGVSKEQLIKDLQQFAEKVDGPPTQEKMEEFGQRYANIYHRHFGSWNNALEEAGLDINKKIECVKSKRQLIEDLQQFAEELGRTPTKGDMNDDGPWDSTTYQRNFGSWNEALKEAGLKINRLDMKELAGTGERAYGSGWEEIRQERLDRDSYICQVCEFKDESNHVHHIKPRSDFDNVSDSNTLDNLITLCSSCHSRCEGRWKDCDPDEFAEKASDTFM